MSAIAFIGCGNMGFALMKAAARVIKPENIFLTDADSEKAHNAAVSAGAKTLKTNIEAAQMCDFIFLAVKPQVLDQVLAEITPAIEKRNPSPVLVSMAAGWSIARIQSYVKTPVVRIMPNTPSLIGKGMIAMSVSQEVSQQKAEELKTLLNGAGLVDIIDERFMNAVTGLSGSGPAFVYLFIEALADGAVHSGMPKDKALYYAVQTVTGAAAMVQETGKQPGELKDMVTSPGGTTLAGIAALENGAFRSTVMKAVEAAKKRAEELG
ncbi:MAG: pyrroline-5-carboxylate reductase [Treponema sp.]|nr:pyrroline-5-carboxylate reductase [Treponema sp.]